MWADIYGLNIFFLSPLISYLYSVSLALVVANYTFLTSWTSGVGVQVMLTRKSELFWKSDPTRMNKQTNQRRCCTLETDTQRCLKCSFIATEELACGCKINPGVFGHRRRRVTTECQEETINPWLHPIIPILQYSMLHRAKWQERRAIPPVQGPASCCFHCTLPAKAICLAST